MTPRGAAQRGAVVVTGASSGIGAACALHLASIGFRVFAGVRKEVDGAALRQRAVGDLTPLRLDVTDETAIAEAAIAVSDAVGLSGLAGLVNNAGIGTPGPLEFLPLDRLRRQFEVNVLGQIAVTQALLPDLRRGRGRVVMIGSATGRVSIPFSGPYCASKAALEALTAALRMELRPWGIPVCTVVPGSIATPMWDKSVADDEELWSSLPERAQSLYAKASIAKRAYTARSGRRGIAASEVARAVAEALTASAPRRRYLVGREAWTAELARLLPESVREALIARTIGLP